MTRMIGLVAAAWIAAATPGQAAGAVSFEVASVKAIPPGEWREPKVFDDRVDFRYVTLKYCVAFAYRLKEYQVSGPPWIGDARYEIMAKGPAGTTRDRLPEMMQALLRERFQLEVRLEKKEYNVFVLAPGKAERKLTASAPPPPGASDGARFNISMNGPVGKIEARHADMTALVNTLPRFVGRPVVNQTNIEGRYDFDVEFSPEDARAFSPSAAANPAVAPPSEFGISIFSSIQRLGLKLDPQRLPLDTVIVEKAEKTPLEN